MFEGGGHRTAGFEAQLCRTTEQWQQASERYRAKRSGVLQRIERARLFQAVNLPPPKDEEKVMRSQWEKDVEQGFASLDVPAQFRTEALERAAAEARRIGADAAFSADPLAVRALPLSCSCNP